MAFALREECAIGTTEFCSNISDAHRNSTHLLRKQERLAAQPQLPAMPPTETLQCRVCVNQYFSCPFTTPLRVYSASGTWRREASTGVEDYCGRARVMAQARYLDIYAPWSSFFLIQPQGVRVLHRQARLRMLLLLLPLLSAVIFAGARRCLPSHWRLLSLAVLGCRRCCHFRLL